MEPFTTRPEIRGTFGVVASTHWIASSAGMAMLERNGNAVDAAVAAGFVLQIAEPHLNGPAGDLPVIFHMAETDSVQVLCGQGVAPAAASLAYFRNLGLDLVPGSGLLPGVVPGAFDAWLLLLRDHGTMELTEVMAPAIEYAGMGIPLLPETARTIGKLAEYFTANWPTSAQTWCPGGVAPPPNALFRNPDLARTYSRLAQSDGPDRKGRIDTARHAWSHGFVAKTIGRYLETAEVPDVTGRSHRGLLTAKDMANWHATFETPVSVGYHGWTVFKTGPWGQGPVLLQALRILENFDLAALDPFGPDFAHVVIEAMKLAFADREAFYGDPDHSKVPLPLLLSAEYGAARAALIGATASLEQRPGNVPGYEAQTRAAVARANRTYAPNQGITAGAGEPTMAHLTQRRGDTVHLDVIDRWGNVVSATPSGGWLQSAPVVPGLGFPLNTRGQMFWLEDEGPNAIAPGRRPRTTLTPTLARHEDGRILSLGTPGGDQQDQWQLVWLLRMIHHGLDMQANMDAPLFHSVHFQSSFYPRQARPGEILVEPELGADTIEALRARGHRVTVTASWALGRLSAALRHPDGQLQAAATPRLMQAYAVGR